MKNNSKIYVAGHSGLIGSALVDLLSKKGFRHLITRTRKQLDLTRQADVRRFFKTERPDYVMLSAARVGGINANMSYPAEFIYENLAIQLNVMHSAYERKVKKLFFFGSACSYPRECKQPMKEEYLLSGALEPTNEPYAIAKIAGIKMCQAYNREYGTNFICGVLTNAYGPHDKFDINDSHVIPALIMNFHKAKAKKMPAVKVWGTGVGRREFIYSQDAASACIFLMQNYNESEVINIGVGSGISIKELALTIKEVVGYQGDILFDASKPDGAPIKLLDNRKINSLGWKAKTPLIEGITKTYRWYTMQLKTGAMIE